MENISTASVIVLVGAVAVFALLYGTGKKKYREYIAPLDKKEFKLKEFLPAGFMVMELSRYSYNTAIDRRNRKYLMELYDLDYVEYYLRVYWAHAMAYGILAVLMGAMANMSMNDPVLGLGIGGGMGAFLPYMALKDLEKKVQERHIEIAMDMPELVNKIVILVGAGLNLQGALAKISKEMYSDRILYRELARTMDRIMDGDSADAAFDYLTIKCNTAEMRRLVSIIVQNIHRGGTDVSSALKSIGTELWASRKAAALRMAEEASTKMLFPMMLMLFAVVLVVAAPAVFNMQI